MVIRYILSGILLLLALPCIAGIAPTLAPYSTANEVFCEYSDGEVIPIPNTMTCSNVTEPNVSNITSADMGQDASANTVLFDANDSAHGGDFDNSDLEYGSCTAADGCPITYSITSGTIPTNTTFDTSTGRLTAADPSTVPVGSYNLTISYSSLNSRASRSFTVAGEVTAAGSSGDVVASIQSLTRVNGVSPETIPLSADETTCADCTDPWGTNDTRADAWSQLSYHWSFDDSDSGSFEATGNSRNSIVTSSPLAAHTFHCLGATDPNWDATDERCKFTVRLRVRAPDGDYDETSIEINIQPLYGTGGYYADANIYCVSSTSNFVPWCPHSDSARHLTDTPAAGSDNFHESLILYDDDGATYSAVCVGADEYNVRVGSRIGSTPANWAIIPKINSSGNPGNPCSGSFNNNATISGVDALAVDGNGHLTAGFGFNQVYFDLRVGEVDAGETHAINQFHNLDMDWEDTGTYDGYFSPANGADGCIEDGSLDCTNLHYPYGFAITDSELSSRCIPGGSGNDVNPAGVNLFGANGTSWVAATVMGTSFERAVEHNLRIMGSYESLYADNLFLGNHVGGSCTGGGGKHYLTIRHPSDDGTQADLTKDPTDIGSGDHIRGTSDATEFVNGKNSIVRNTFGQATMDANHSPSSWVHVKSIYGVFDKNTLVYTGDDGNRQLARGGNYWMIRNTTWASPHTTQYCSNLDNTLPDGTAWNDQTTSRTDEQTINCDSITVVPVLTDAAAPGS